ncbi:hypothetical protein EV2_026202 [Malus domestica]
MSAIIPMNLGVMFLMMLFSPTSLSGTCLISPGSSGPTSGGRTIISGLHFGCDPPNIARYMDSAVLLVFATSNKCLFVYAWKGLNRELQKTGTWRITRKGA